MVKHTPETLIEWTKQPLFWNPQVRTSDNMMLVLGLNKIASAEEITQYESVEKKYLRIGDMKQNTQRERERTKNISIIKNATVTM